MHELPTLVDVDDGTRTRIAVIPARPPICMHRHALLCALMFAFVFLQAMSFAAPLFAQSTTVTTPVVVHQYVRDSWHDVEGLPRQGVSSIEQTGDGYLWLGSGQRVLRFDGVRFTTVLRSDSLAGEGGRPITRTPLLRFVDAHGDLWISYESGKIAKYTNGRFATITAYDSKMLFGPEVPSPTPDGGLWAIFRDELFRWENGKYTPALLNGEKFKGIGTLATDAMGVRYVGFRDGRILRSRGAVDTWLQLPPMKDPNAERIIADTNGTVWIRYLHSIVRWKDGKGEIVSPLDSSIQYTAITSDNEQGVWVATDVQGLWHVNASGQIIGRIEATELDHAEVWALRVDKEGSIWVGTSAGLERFRKAPFTWYEIPGGITDLNAIGAVWADSQTFWTSNTRGNIRRIVLSPMLRALAANAPTPVTLATTTTSAFALNPLTSLSAATRDGIWSATGVAVQHWSAKTGEQRTFNGLDSAGGTYQVLETSRGVTWAFTRRGLFRLDGDTFRRFVPTNQSRVRMPNYFGFGMIYEGTNGHVWFGGGTLMEVADDSLVMYTMKTGLGGQPVQAIAQDAAGTIWASSGIGNLTRVRNNVAVPVSLGAQNAESYVTGLAADTLGFLWMAGDAGVQRASLNELNAVADGRDSSVALTTFTTADGLPGQSVAGYRGIYRAPSGALMFSFLRGIAVVDPANLYPNPVPPPVHIEDVFGDERVISRETLAAGLRPQTYRVEFQFTATSLLIPARMRFRYRLEGAENTWTEVSGLTRSATYTRLAPGPYTFRVQAANNDGVWNPVSASLAFRVLPLWYQTWWARTGGVLIVVAIGAIAALTVARVRLGRSEARIHAMMEERTRIAREVHDTLLQGFTGITLQLQGLKGKLRRSPETMEASMESLLETADATLLAARQAVWEMRPPDLERATLSEALGVALRRTTGERPALNYRVIGIPRRFPPETEAAVLRIGVEAASNAVKHAHATELDVELAFSRNDVKLCVRDDGCGFDVEPMTASSGTHFGLIGIRERARKVGATIAIDSTPGRGTTIVMSAEDRPARWFGMRV